MVSDRKERFNNCIMVIILAGLILLIAAYSPLGPFRRCGLTTDQSVFMTIARGITRGRLAYTDYFDHKGPLLYLLLAAGLRLSRVLPGNEFAGCWLIEIAVIAVSVIFLYRIARMYADRWIALTPVLAVFFLDMFFFTTSNSEEYIFPLEAISIWLFIRQIRNDVRMKEVFVIGICGMLTFFIKYNYCIIWAGLGVLLFIHMLAHHMKVKKVIGMCVAFASGMAVAAVPFLIYLNVTGSFEDFLDAYVFYSIQYAGYTGIGARLSCMFFMVETRLAWYLIGFGILCVVILMAWLVGHREHLPATEYLHVEEWLYWVLLMAIVLIAASSPGQRWVYYRQSTMVIYMLPIAAVNTVLFHYLAKVLPSGLAAAGVGLALLFTVRAGIMGLRGLTVEDPRYASTRTVAEYIRDNTSERDTIIAFSNDCSMYFYSGLEPASRIFFPSAAIVDDKLRMELMQELKAQQPAFVTMQTDWKAGLQEKMVRDVEAFIGDSYRLVYQDAYRSVYARK